MWPNHSTDEANHKAISSHSQQNWKHCHCHVTLLPFKYVCVLGTNRTGWRSSNQEVACSGLCPSIGCRNESFFLDSTQSRPPNADTSPIRPLPVISKSLLIHRSPVIVPEMLYSLEILQQLCVTHKNSNWPNIRPGMAYRQHCQKWPNFAIIEVSGSRNGYNKWQVWWCVWWWN
jgi:hypothetical protein